MSRVDAVGEAGELESIGDEDAAGWVGAEGKGKEGGVHVDGVWDEAVVGGFGGGDQAGETGVTVVEWGHGIEDVREGGGAGVEGGEACGVG